MIRLAVRVRRQDAELVLAELLELAPAGVEELEPDADIVEFAVYGAPGELPSLPALHAAAGDALVEISTSEIADDWSERWRTFHQPTLVELPPEDRGQGARAHVPALGIRPPWVGADVWGSRRAHDDRGAHDDRDAYDVRDIVIDPAQAFGTGSHGTTRLCLELLLELAAFERTRGALVDVGTGSGVLAIAAAMLGFAPVLALDHDRESVTAASANAAANAVELDVRRLDIRCEPPQLPAADAGAVVVLANLLAPLLDTLARALPVAPAHLIAGGLLHEQADAAARAFADSLGMRERTRRARGEWSALWLVAA